MVGQPIAFVHHNTSLVTVANSNFAIVAYLAWWLYEDIGLRVHGYNSTHSRMRSAFHELRAETKFEKGASDRPYGPRPW